MAKTRKTFTSVAGHIAETVDGRLKWRYRFNTYTLRVPYTAGRWLNHTVVIKQKAAYFNIKDAGWWFKGVFHMSDDEYPKLIRAILLGGLEDGK